MMDSATIHRMSQEAARIAARERRLPYVVWPEDLTMWKAAISAGRLPHFPFPNLGTYRPRGWKPGRELFCDSSGWNRDDEPALSIRQLVAELQVGKAYAVTECGEFQLYLTEFEPPRATFMKRKAVAHA